MSSQGASQLFSEMLLTAAFTELPILGVSYHGGDQEIVKRKEDAKPASALSLQLPFLVI